MLGFNMCTLNTMLYRCEPESMTGIEALINEPLALENALTIRNLMITLRYSVKRLQYRLLQCWSSRSLSIPEQEIILEHLLPKFVLNDDTFPTIMDLLLRKFDPQLLPKILEFFQSFPYLASTHLSVESSPPSIWLRLMLAEKWDDIELANLNAAPDPLGFPLKQLIGNFSSKDIDNILKDPSNSFFSDSMKVVIRYLEHCDQVPIETLFRIVKAPVEKELVGPLCNVIIRHQGMKMLSDRFQQESGNFKIFNEVETWCDILLRLNPSEVVEFLSGLMGHSDEFWVQISEWLAQNQSILNFLRPDLIERIKSLESLPGSFIISLSLFNMNPVKIPSTDLDMCISPRQLESYDNSKCLLLSLLTTALGTSRVGKVSRSHIILSYLAASSLALEEYIEYFSLSISALLYNAGMSSSESIVEYLEINSEAAVRKFDADLKILRSIRTASPLGEIDPARVAFLLLIIEASNGSDHALIAEYGSKIFSRVLAYEASRFTGKTGFDFDKATSPVRRCLKHISPTQVEGSFLVFLHDFGQSWDNGGGSMESIVALRILKVYAQLVPSLVVAHSAKLLPILAEAFGRPDVAIFKDDLVDTSNMLLALLNLPELLRIVLEIGLCLFEPGNQLTRDSLKSLEKSLATLPISLLLKFVEREYLGSGKKSDSFPADELGIYQSIVKRAVGSTGLDAKDRLKAQELLISLGAGAENSEILRSSSVASVDKNVCCYSQLHMIRFAVHHLKALVRNISIEADISKRNSLAFTIQRLCRFLNLSSEKSEVWDAFDSAQKELIKPFLSSKYRFEYELSSRPVPIILKVVDLPDWMSSMFCQINSNFDFDPEFQSFMSTFAAIILYEGTSHFEILAAFVISALIRVESFAVTLSQEYTANPCLNPELNQKLLDLYDMIFEFYIRSLNSEHDLNPQEIERLRNFIESLPTTSLAKIASAISDYHRALRYLELHYRFSEGSDRLGLVGQIQSYHYAIGQPYNGNGLADFFSPRDVRQLPFSLDMENRTALSLAVRKHLLQNMESSKFEISHMLSTFVGQLSYEDVLSVVTSSSLKKPDLLDTIKEYEEEACAALSKWEIAQPDYGSFGSIGEHCPSWTSSLLSWFTNETPVLQCPEVLDARAIDVITAKVLKPSELLSVWKSSKADTSEENFLTRVKFRRSLIELIDDESAAPIKNQLDCDFIKGLHRKDLFSEALSEFLKLNASIRDTNVLLEAQLLKENGLVVRSIEVLQFALDERTVEENLQYKVHLRLAEYKSSSGHYAEKDILKHFEAAAKLSANSKVFFKFAKFLDHDFGLLSTQQDEIVLKKAYLALKNYSRALMASEIHDIEVVPRFLTIWFDICSNSLKASVWSEKVNAVMAKAIRMIRSSQFYRALPQLVSRIMHSNKVTFDLLQTVFAKVFSVYPHAVLWSIIAVVKSSIANRQKRAIDIVLKLRKDPAHGHLCKDYSSFADTLISMANLKPMDGIRIMSVSKDFPLLKKCFPLQIQIPAALHRWGDEFVGFDSILDRIDIIMSMQKPKKVVFKGSNGRSYPFLCKPNDDLRKDYRMIELFDLTNDLFKQSPNNIRDFLGIARFSVTALNEEAGLVEWVPNTQSFRSIVLQMYKRDNIPVSFRDIKANLKNDPDPVGYYTNEILPRFPIVFDKWMIERFCDAKEWINARNLFAGSAACISMLGHIVGLGDRHGENILIDDSTGKCVHVDFNCLFEKGKTFEVPELVPFRLTRNMLAGMGLPEWRGLFLKCSEHSLQVFRDNRDLLQTNLESFVYDPMLDWIKDKRANSESINEKGLEIMQLSMDKISGKNGTRHFSTPLGQALDLIDEAVDVNNLSRMYIGWSAFI